MNVLKLLPPLLIGERDREWLVSALDAVIADCHKVPGSAWELGKTLAGHALKARAG
jgi:ornithine--oxo-acid transaminase